MSEADRQYFVDRFGRSAGQMLDCIVEGDYIEAGEILNNLLLGEGLPEYTYYRVLASWAENIRNREY